MKKAAVALPLLMASLAFASKAGENFGQSMALWPLTRLSSSG